MLTAVLLAATFAPAADDVSLEDVKRFTDLDRDEIKARWQTTQYYQLFLQDARRNAGDKNRKKELEAEINAHSTTVSAYMELYNLKDPKSRDSQKIRTLRSLRRYLGEAAYKAGGLPPLYPAKADKEFRAWLDRKFQQGLEDH
jgi:hypothetical protein